MIRMSSLAMIAVTAFSISAFAPAALAQTTIDAGVTQHATNVSEQMAMNQPPAGNTGSCFTQDFVPGDDSSMATICGASAAPVVSFAP